MSNKKECEIVQDLLINYVDEILNPESKKLVDNHLIECEKCQIRLMQIKEDTKKIDTKEKIEIDYLRKLRTKAKIKSIFMTFGFLFIICFIYYFVKFIKINNIINKTEKIFETNNYYTEEITSSNDDTASAIKKYYKDGKYKELIELYSDTGKEIVMETYSSIDSNQIIKIDYRNGLAIIEDGKYADLINNSEEYKKNNKTNILKKLQSVFTYSIKIDTYDIGKEYYVLKDKFNNNDRHETWVDKETGLTIRRIFKNSSKTYFPGTEIPKSVNDIIINYKYDFGNVTDEDVKVPDLSNYKIKYDTTLNDLINDANKTINKE